MVKNKTGGKNAKKGARKNLNQESFGRKIRMIENEGEHYGIVTKMLGGGHMEVRCMDDRLRLCVIRYKFSGRNKSSNLITTGSWVIVGLRSWETTKPDKLEKCDLLEIYSHAEKTKLVQDCGQNISVLIKHENVSGGGGEGEDPLDDIIFSNEVESANSGGDSIAVSGEGGDAMPNHVLEEEIDFDEI